MGLLITFEGVEGSGKTTQLRALAKRLRGAGHQTLETREPGGTDLGEGIRRLLLERRDGGVAGATELFLYEASRAQLVREVIDPALRRGCVVLCDRFADATVAYQGYGRGLDLTLIRRLNELATGGVAPDLSLLLDLDPAVGLRRIGRALDRLEAEDLAFHRRVREGYLTLAAEESGRFRVIDAALAPERIEEAVWQGVEDRLRVRTGAPGAGA